MGFFRVPLFNMMSFSTKWGMGLNGIRSMMTENTMRIEYGVLSRNDNMRFIFYLTILEVFKISS
jgi:hypothetical protein